MARMIYGTAWKEASTAGLVFEAIKAGFRAIDTAAMTKHYNEAGCGEGIRRAIDKGLVTRSDLYVQTKVSPGDPAFADTTKFPDIPSQVRASVKQSLQRLRASENDSDTTYLDCVVLHSPYPRHTDTIAAWRELSTFLPHQIRSLGISNVTYPELRALLDTPDLTRPTVVQNRFAAREHSWDVDVRSLCAKEKITYQGFWTLSANPREWQQADYVGAVAAGAGVSRAVAWYALMMATDIVVLNGTTSAEHMREDLAGVGEVDAWRNTAEGKELFEQALEVFRRRTGTA